MKKLIRDCLLLLVVFSGINITAAYAGPKLFNSEAAFQKEIAGYDMQTEDFENCPPDFPSGDSFGGITFTNDNPNEYFLVDMLYPATSGFFSLGSYNNFDAFGADAGVELTFESPVNAIGMQIIVHDNYPMWGDEIQLNTDVGSVSLWPFLESTDLGGGSTAFFLGLVSDELFSSARIDSQIFLGGDFSFTIDDITRATAPVVSTVPEPGTFLMLGMGILGFVGFLRRSSVEGA